MKTTKINLSQTQINDLNIDKNILKNITNEEFISFDNEEDVKNTMVDSHFSSYNQILILLSEGYEYSDLIEVGISKENLNSFKKFLNENHTTLAVALAFNEYSSDSKMITQKMRGVSNIEIKAKLENDFIDRLLQEKIPLNDIYSLLSYAEALDYSKPLFRNYNQVKYDLQNKSYKKSNIRAVNNFVQQLNNFYHLNDTIKNLQKGMEYKSSKSLRLYRAVKGEFLSKKYGFDLNNIDSLKGKVISDDSFSSTSMLYETSFAKYQEYDVVYEIFAPKGTKMTSIIPFSNYDNVEYEVLCNTSNLYIFNANKITDKFGNNKILLQSIMLNKEKNLQKNNIQSIENKI